MKNLLWLHSSTAIWRSKIHVLKWLHNTTRTFIRIIISYQREVNPFSLEKQHLHVPCDIDTTVFNTSYNDANDSMIILGGALYMCWSKWVHVPRSIHLQFRWKFQTYANANKTGGFYSEKYCKHSK